MYVLTYTVHPSAKVRIRTSLSDDMLGMSPWSAPCAPGGSRAATGGQGFWTEERVIRSLGVRIPPQISLVNRKFELPTIHSQDYFGL